MQFIDSFLIDKVKRFCKASREHVDVLCPQIVKHYNRHMGGVDLADTLIALYQTSIKSHRWYLNIFSQILDMCINNGWLLCRRHYKCSNIKIKADHLKQFRQMTTTVREKPAAERPVDAIRYDCVDHWPEHPNYT